MPDVSTINDPSFVYILMTHVLRDERLLQRVGHIIRPEDFSRDGEKMWGLVYSIAQRYFANHYALVPRSVMDLEIDALLEGDQDFLTDDQCSQLGAMLDAIYTTPVTDLATDWVLAQAQLFVDDRRLRSAGYAVGSADPSEIAARLLDLTRTHQSTRISAGESVSGFRTGEVELRQVPRTPTGCPWFDALLGGIRPEVCGFLGPTGGGKTLCAIQLTVEVMRNCNLHSAYLAYENDFDPEYKTRFYGYMGGLKSEQISGVSSDAFTPEVSERINAAVDAYGQYFHPRNMVSAAGGVPQIRAFLKEQEAQGEPIRFMVIDQHEPMIRRYMAATGKGEDTLRLEFKATVDELMQLASEMSCFILLLHQLSGVANEKPPSVRPAFTDAAECKGWSNWMQNTMCLGKRDRHGLGWIVADKVRGGAKGEIITRMRGDLFRMDYTADRYELRGKEFIDTHATPDVSQFTLQGSMQGSDLM